MPPVRSADDAFLLAIDLERRGYDFYHAAAQAAPHGPLRDVLLRLRDWEAQHARTLETLRQELPATLRHAEHGDPRRFDVAARRHLLVDEPDPAAVVARCPTPQDLLHTALRFEQDALVLYSAMIDLVPAEAGREHLHTLVDQELSHVILLHETLMMAAPDGTLPPGLPGSS